MILTYPQVASRCSFATGFSAKRQRDMVFCSEIATTMGDLSLVFRENVPLCRKREHRGSQKETIDGCDTQFFVSNESPPTNLSTGLFRLLRPSDHHLFGGGQCQLRVVTFDPVYVPLQACEVHRVAVVVFGDVALVG